MLNVDTALNSSSRRKRGRPAVGKMAGDSTRELQTAFGNPVLD